MKKRLFTPGPTEVPPEVLKALGSPIPHHRKPEFKEVFLKVRGKLKELMRSQRDAVIFSSSGTGAMVAAVTNFFSPGDKVLVITAGKFGERWCEITKTFGLDADCLEYPYGDTFDKEEVRKRLSHGYRGVFVQHTETSTGTEHDVRFLGEIVPDETLLVVDAVSSFGVYEILPEEWGIDVLVWGSQKGLMLPPGLSFLWFSKKAEAALNDSGFPKYYFDVKKEFESQAKARPLFTPAVGLIMGLDVALDLLLKEGIKRVEERHRRIAKIIRKGVKESNFRLFSHHPAINLTAIKVPEGVTDVEIIGFFDEHGIKIAPGQGSMKGKIFRIGHMGYVDEADALMISALLGELRRQIDRMQKF